MSLKLAVIGGVAGGAGAATAARRANEDAEITIFEAGPYISFANCGLPYYVSGEIDTREKLLVTKPEMLQKRFRIDVCTRHEVLKIDRKKKTLSVRNHATGKTFDHPYDKLIIATGATSFSLPIEGLDRPRVMECRTIDDVDCIYAAAEQYPKSRVLVIGGGFIGIEVVEALSMRGHGVTLVELADQILPPMDADIAAAGLEELEKHGVDTKLGVTVQRFEHGDNGSVAVLSTGEKIDIAFAVVAVGVQPNTSIAKEAGLDIGATGGLVVDEHQRTSDENIFAAGDVTELFYWPTQSHMKLALAGPANKQARVAGANAASDARAPLATSGAAGTSIVRVFDLGIAMTGLSEKLSRKLKLNVQTVMTQNGHHAGYFPGAQPLLIKLIFDAESGRVLGGQVVGAAGADKRVDVLSTAIQAGFTVEQLADLDLAYSPPYGAAKDPLVIAGMVAANAWRGRTNLMTAAELADELAGDDAPWVLDVRTQQEHEAGSIDGAVNIPIDELRDRLGEVPKDRAIVTHCAVGYRGYLAEQILKQHGYKRVRNLTGGIRAWGLVAAPRTAGG